MLRSRIVRAAAAAAATAALSTLAFTGAASAGVTGTAATTDGMAGYFGNALGQNFRSAAATFDLTTQAENIGTTTDLARPQGAEGIQLCNNSTGQAAELGVTYNGGGTFSVDYATGTLPVNNNDPCVNNGILHNGGHLHALLAALPAGDSAAVLIMEENHGTVFAAEDVSSGRSFETWVPFGGHWRGHGRGWAWDPRPRYDEPGAGVQQDLQLLGGDAKFDLVDFTGVTVAAGVTPFPAVALGSVNDITVDSSATGNPAWLVGPAQSSTTGPNGDPCSASLTTGLQFPPLTAGGPQYGPLAAGGSAFSICAAGVV